VNLGLLVSPPGADGYHDLHTVFQAVGIYDELRIEAERARRGAVEVECDVPSLTGPENLVVRATEAVLQELRLKAEVKLRLRKRIPLGGGMGGGSSDAAGVLRALPPLLGRPLPLSRLLEIGARLGADVPFFLIGGRAAGLGRGTEVFPLPEEPPRPVVVVHPDFHVSTAEAYQKLDESRRSAGQAEGLVPCQDAATAAATLTSGAQDHMIFYFCASIYRRRWDRLANHFEPVVFSAYPQLARLKRLLLRAGASPALLSGSGSAMFGMFAAVAAARQAAAQVREQWPQWSVWVTRTLRGRKPSSECFADEQPSEDF
jgi:4-diphosphocytidyl-2-C-methyl-D-erythritol kinase